VGVTVDGAMVGDLVGKGISGLVGARDGEKVVEEGIDIDIVDERKKPNSCISEIGEIENVQ
jgi:hypothetical protein